MPQEENKTTEPVDYSKLSDEQFRQLANPLDEASSASEEEEVVETVEEEVGNGEVTGTDDEPGVGGEEAVDDAGGAEGEEEVDGEEEGEEVEDGEEVEPEAEDASAGEEDEGSEEEGADTGQGGEPVVEKTPVKEGAATPAGAGYFKIPDGMDKDTLAAALAFYDKVSSPIKANGRKLKVKSAEDAVRLMRQGAGYHKKMEQLRPARDISRTLAENGLSDPNAINYLIDLAKGNKSAIIEMLKKHKINPVDLDIEEDSNYQVTNYAGSKEDNLFRDVLDEVSATPDGQALVLEVKTQWDKESQDNLRSNPATLSNLLFLKQQGIYDKVVEQVNYERDTGNLIGVPFLQAFDAVGERMRETGMLNVAEPEAKVPAPVRSKPVAKGSRKQTGKKKSGASPNLSSANVTKGKSKVTDKVIDYSKLSDEEFRKLPNPLDQ